MIAPGCSASEVKSLIGKIYRFRPKIFRFMGLGGRIRRLPSPALSDPIDVEVIETIRNAVDRCSEDGESRTVTLCATRLVAATAKLDINEHLAPELTVITDDGFDDVGTGRIQLNNPVYGGSQLRFEFSVPGRYLAEICIDCPITAVVRITERRPARETIPHVELGQMEFSEYFSPCRDRLTFVFDVRDSPMYYLSLEFDSPDQMPVFRWAKFTRLGATQTTRGYV